MTALLIGFACCSTDQQAVRHRTQTVGTRNLNPGQQALVVLTRRL